MSPLFDAEYLRIGTRYRSSYNGIGTYTCRTQGYHFEWPWVTLNDLAKYSTTRSIATAELLVFNKKNRMTLSKLAAHSHMDRGHRRYSSIVGQSIPQKVLINTSAWGACRIKFLFRTSPARTTVAHNHVILAELGSGIMHNNASSTRWCIMYITARPRPLLGHPAVHANCECTACSAITFSYCTAVQKQLLHCTPHSLTCTVWLSTTPEKHQTHRELNNCTLSTTQLM